MLNLGFPSHLFFFLVILFSIVSRNKEINENYLELNKSYFFLHNELKAFKFPRNSQIVLVGEIASHSFGMSAWSSGFISFLLKRGDVSGLAPFEYNYYDAFQKGGGYSPLMVGLDSNKPIFLFRANVWSKKMTQLQFALRWKTNFLPGYIEMLISEDKIKLSESDKYKNADWEILQFERETGKSRVIATGKGFKEYKNYLQKLEANGITQEEILWGGKPSIEDMKRLNN